MFGDARSRADDTSAEPRSRQRSGARRAALIGIFFLGVTGVAAAVVFKRERDEVIAGGRGLAALEATQREHEGRLAELQRDIAESQRRAEAARRAAALATCHADAERIDAAVAWRAAGCARQVAAAEACLASNARSKGESMRTGCGLGMLAMFTGVGAIWALGACVAGEVYGESQQVECPTPTCTGESRDWLRSEARAIGREGMPLCELGVEAIDMASSFDGGLIVKAAGAGAARAGVLGGDIIVRVGGVRVRADGDVELDDRRTMEVELVRSGVLRALRVETSVHEGRRILGVELQPVREVSFTETQIVLVEQGASESGFKKGDVINGLGTVLPRQAADLSREVRAGVRGPVRVRRGDRHLELASPP